MARDYTPVTWTQFATLADHRLNELFGKWGLIVGRHPRIVVVATLILVAILGSGMSLIKAETDSETLYAPKGSQAMKDRKTFEALWGNEVNRFGNVIITGKDGENILTKEFLKKALLVHETIMNVEFTFEGKQYTYSDICVKPPIGPTASCTIRSILAAWNYDADLIDQDPDILATINSPITLDPNGFPLEERNNLLGGIQPSVESIQTATALFFGYDTVATTEEDEDRSAEWETEFLEAVEDLEIDGFTIFRNAYRSFDDELANAAGGDITLMSITFTIVFTYAVCVFFRRDLVRSQTLLGLGGVVGVGFSILMGFGLAAYLQVPFSAIVGALPFLVVSIGVDDMFIIVDSFNRTNPTKNVPERISDTLRDCGSSITMTMLTDLVAFLIGYQTEFQSVKWFCVYSACCVSMDFVQQITFFVALLTFDAKKQEANRYDIVPCIKRASAKASPKKTEEADEDKSYEAQVKEFSSRSKYSIDYWMYRLSLILTYRLAKLFVIVAFLIMLIVMFVASLQLDQGLELKDLAMEDSYLTNYNEFLDDNFEQSGDSFYVTTYNVNFTQQSTRQAMKLLATSFREEGTEYYRSVPVNTFWLGSFEQWQAQQNLTDSEAEFYSQLENFLNNPFYSYFKDFALNFNKDGTLQAARFVVNMHDLNSQEQGSSMKKAREIVQESEDPLGSSNTFPYNEGYIFYEQYVITLREVVVNLVCAIISVFLISVVLLIHASAAIYSVICVVMIDINIFGMMAFWDVPLNAVSMINLVMSVGFSVDYVSHAAKAFMECTGTRNERLVLTLSTVGSSVFSGGFSSLLGVLVLAFASSPIFVVFFKMFFGSVVFGLLHGLLFLPVVLSIIGPQPAEVADKKGPIEYPNEDVEAFWRAWKWVRLAVHALATVAMMLILLWVILALILLQADLEFQQSFSLYLSIVICIALLFIEARNQVFFEKAPSYGLPHFKDIPAEWIGRGVFYFYTGGRILSQSLPDYDSDVPIEELQIGTSLFMIIMAFAYIVMGGLTLFMEHKLGGSTQESHELKVLPEQKGKEVSVVDLDRMPNKDSFPSQSPKSHRKSKASSENSEKINSPAKGDGKKHRERSGNDENGNHKSKHHKHAERGNKEKPKKKEKEVKTVSDESKVVKKSSSDRDPSPQISIDKENDSIDQSQHEEENQKPKEVPLNVSNTKELKNAAIETKKLSSSNAVEETNVEDEKKADSPPQKQEPIRDSARKKIVEKKSTHIINSTWGKGTEEEIEEEKEDKRSKIANEASFLSVPTTKRKTVMAKKSTHIIDSSWGSSAGDRKQLEEQENEDSAEKVPEDKSIQINAEGKEEKETGKNLLAPSGGIKKKMGPKKSTHILTPAWGKGAEKNEETSAPPTGGSKDEVELLKPAPKKAMMSKKSTHIIQPSWGENSIDKDTPESPSTLAPEDTYSYKSSKKPKKKMITKKSTHIIEHSWGEEEKPEIPQFQITSADDS